LATIWCRSGCSSGKEQRMTQDDEAEGADWEASPAAGCGRDAIHDHPSAVERMPC
jgi:hypothetical protein